MALEVKGGQKRKRSTPYEGRKSTRKPRKFKKQEYYNSSSSEGEDEPMPSWRNGTKGTATDTPKEQDVGSESAGNRDPVETGPHTVVEGIQDLTPAVAVAAEVNPITFADLVKPALVESHDEPQSRRLDIDSEPSDLENFDPAAPVQLSDDEMSDSEIDEVELRTQTLADAADVSSNSGVDEYEIDSDEATTTNASTTTRALRKRNDPSAFAASMSAILGSKLTAGKRADPVLSRSATAVAAAKELVEDKLEAKAKRKMKADKHGRLEKGRVKDVLGLDRSARKDEESAKDQVTTGEIALKEKQLKKVAQRGVLTLFNAVRNAQMKGFEAENQVRIEGKIGIDGRKEKINEMSKKGFLDLLTSGGS